jgi:hypothetical protein
VGLFLDYATGPVIQFPLIFIFPVMLAGWFNGKWWGLGFAVVLSLCRFYFSMIWEPQFEFYTTTGGLINLGIRLVTLSVLALLMDKMAQQTREIRVLKGLLPVCSFCKKIRDESQDWQPIESFISQRSEADFTHTVCPECAKKHYPNIS